MTTIESKRNLQICRNFIIPQLPPTIDTIELIYLTY